MQNSTIDEVRLALNNENWEFADAKSLNSGNTTCNFISWKNYKEKLSVYNLSEKQNFVVYHSDSECFNNLFKSFTKGTSKVDDNQLISSFKEGLLNVDFISFKNHVSEIEYVIWVYNSTIPLPDEIINVPAKFPDGLESFKRRFQDNFDNNFLEEGSSRVTANITFTVERDGTISDIQVLGQNTTLNEEAVRTIKSIKTIWIPAKRGGVPIRSKIKIPISWGW